MEQHILLLCLLGNPYDFVLGGYQKTIYEIIEYFKNSKKINFTIITTNTSVENINFQQLYNNIKYYEIGIPKKWVDDQDNLFENRKYLFDKIEKIYLEAKSNFTLLHTTYWISGFIGVEISQKYHIPQIHSPISISYEKVSHGFTLRSQFQRMTEEITFKNADLILSITKAESDILQKEYRIDSKKIKIIGRVVDLCFQHPAHSPSGNLSSKAKMSLLKDMQSKHYLSDNWWMQNAFCYVGRIVDYKGIKEIIQAWEILYHKYYDQTPPLWIIGGNCNDIATYRSDIINLIPDLQLYEKNHKIYWWGYATAEGISNILLKCSVLIMHSGFEPGGRVVLESLALGKPIIATPYGFARDFVQDWYNGFQVPYKNIYHLALYMDFFVKNEYLSNMLGINAQHMYQYLESTWGYFTQMEKIYYNYEEKSFIKLHSTDYNQEENVKIGLVDAFPYCSIKNSLDDLSEEFLITKKNIKPMYSPYSYLWSTDSIIIKQYFHRINFQQLWNTNDTRKIIGLTDLFQATIYCDQFNSVLPIYKKSDVSFSYLMPKAFVLSQEECLLQMPIIINQFQEEAAAHIELSKNINYKNLLHLNKNIQKQHKHYTRHMLLGELMQVIEINRAIFIQEEYKLLHKIISNLGEYIGDCSYGLNYGKSLLNHVVMWNSTPYLLPSGEIYWGEVGFDAAKTYIEYYGEAKICRILTSITSNNNLIMWIFCLLIEEYIKSKILLWKTTINLEEIAVLIKEYFTL